MFERETKREKILEARHREMRLKERARSEGQGLEAEEMLEESPQDALDRAQKEFFEVIEAELQRRARAEAQQPGGSKVLGPAAVSIPSPAWQCGGDQWSSAGDTDQPLPFRLKNTQRRRWRLRGRKASCPSTRKRTRKRTLPRSTQTILVLLSPSLLGWLLRGWCRDEAPTWVPGVSASVGQPQTLCLLSPQEP